MIYLDTSVAVPLLVPEPKTADVTAWFSGLNETLVGSDWLLAEFASAVSIKECVGELSESHAAMVRRTFESFCAGLRIVQVSRAAFREAARYAGQQNNGLRAGDALHLAVAMEIGAASLATLDGRLADNARRQALNVEPICP